MEILTKQDVGSMYVAKEGWALFERPPPTRLPVKAKDYLVELFEGGKMDKNHRVSPEVAELKLRDKFPRSEDCWLTKKQVCIIWQHFETYNVFQIKGVFSRLAAGKEKEENTEEHEVERDFDNLEAELIMSDTVTEIKKKKKKTV